MNLLSASEQEAVVVRKPVSAVSGEAEVWKNKKKLCVGMFLQEEGLLSFADRGRKTTLNLAKLEFIGMQDAGLVLEFELDDKVEIRPLNLGVVDVSMAERWLVTLVQWASFLLQKPVVAFVTRPVDKASKRKSWNRSLGRSSGNRVSKGRVSLGVIEVDEPPPPPLPVAAPLVAESRTSGKDLKNEVAKAVVDIKASDPKGKKGLTGGGGLKKKGTDKEFQSPGWRVNGKTWNKVFWRIRNGYLMCFLTEKDSNPISFFSLNVIESVSIVNVEDKKVVLELVMRNKKRHQMAVEGKSLAEQWRVNLSNNASSSEPAPQASAAVAGRNVQISGPSDVVRQSYADPPPSLSSVQSSGISNARNVQIGGPSDAGHQSYSDPPAAANPVQNARVPAPKITFEPRPAVVQLRPVQQPRAAVVRPTSDRQDIDYSFMHTTGEGLMEDEEAMLTDLRAEHDNVSGTVSYEVPDAGNLGMSTGQLMYLPVPVEVQPETRPRGETTRFLSDLEEMHTVAVTTAVEVEVVPESSHLRPVDVSALHMISRGCLTELEEYDGDTTGTEMSSQLGEFLCDVLEELEDDMIDVKHVRARFDTISGTTHADFKAAVEHAVRKKTLMRCGNLDDAAEKAQTALQLREGLELLMEDVPPEEEAPPPPPARRSQALAPPSKPLPVPGSREIAVNALTPGRYA